MTRLLIVAAVLFSATASNAQQQPDPAFLQRALTALQTQRNQALDMAAAQQARADGLTDDLAKAQSKVKELEAQAAPPAKK
jgi:Ni/Co efflux regulator RcnB